MPSYTTPLGLTLPDGSEKVLLKVINDNMMTIAKRSRIIDVKLPLTAWTGTSAFTAAIDLASITEHTAVVECKFDADSARNQTADIDWTTTAGKLTLKTSAKPTGPLTGYMILEEVATE